MADDSPRRHLRHLRFRANPEPLPYSRTSRKKTLIASQDRAAHARFLKTQVAQIDQEFEGVAAERAKEGLSREFGLILNVVSEPGVPLAFPSLENAGRGSTPSIVLLNLRFEGEGSERVTRAAVFVPFGQLKVLQTKIEDYSKPEKDKKDGPANQTLIANIASISTATFDALWTDPGELPSREEPTWFELWIRRDEDHWIDQLEAEVSRLGLDFPDLKLILPEHVVTVLRATRARLESSLDLLNTLSEVRKARPCSVGLTDLRGIEQEEWIDEALDRIQWPAEDAPAVCLIDSGVNRAHPLIEPLLGPDDSDTIFSDDDRSDDLHHGTPMAGLAAYGDLRTLMLSSGMWAQLHRLESVKLIRGSTDHDPDNYGKLTQQALDLPVIFSSRRNRVFCMAITSSGPNTQGNPSAWSSAIDQAAGGFESDESAPRVIILAAGNVRQHPDHFQYPDAITGAPLEDPAQAWNAVTVGAVTSRNHIEEGDHQAQACQAMAPRHGLSPFTRTSHDWRPDWPIGPDIVMEGGNLGRAPDGSCPHYDSLQLTSCATNFAIRPIAPFNATSAAAAQAARVAARIVATYPDLQPETVRGLLVHSARWPDELLARESLDPHAAGGTADVEQLMRGYGFGIVDESRAVTSLNNKATMMFEGTIHPYRGEWNDTKLNECHLIELPWPADLLLQNQNESATLRVTLSYFIEPNPGSRTWERSQKYHYAGALLRFRPKYSSQPPEDFRNNLDAGAESSESPPSDPGWAVGGRHRGKMGSLVQDVWRGTTDELATMGHIGVYPAKGWWAYRNFREGHELHGRHLRPVNYSLIVSLETEADLPIYNEVAAAINRIESSIDLST